MTKTGRFTDSAFVWLTISLFRAGLDTRPGRFAKECGLDPGPDLLEYIADRVYLDPSERHREIDRAMADADRARAMAARLGFLLVSFGDEAYPGHLRTISDPPLALWVNGDPKTLTEPAVGVVGSRDAVPASLAVARRLGRELSEAGLTVVSGLARGVDGAAHAGALEASGRTVAVLGSGLDVVYPSRHKPLADEVSRTGAVVSELPPWARPVGRHFPLRNRIISGLSRAVVVVEASEHSGSLITAKAALEQGRDVLAVPGGIMSGRHRGSHGLIKDGARLVETVEDILEEIRWIRPAGGTSAYSGNSLPVSGLEAMMAEGESYSVEEMARLADRPASELLADMSMLELSGRLTRLPGGHFMRSAPSRKR